MQVKERVKGFLEHMLQRMAADHCQQDREQNSTSSVAEPEISPVVGKADDGVQNIPVHALVVTHGAYIRVMLRYFMEELHCSLPEGSDKAHMISLCPNTGICRFIVTVRKEEDQVKLPAIRSVFIHRGNHVKDQV